MKVLCKNKKQILRRIGVLHIFLMKRLCLTLKICIIRRTIILSSINLNNKFFFNIVPNLKISTYHGYDNDFIATDDQVTDAVNNFQVSL